MIYLKKKNNYMNDGAKSIKQLRDSRNFVIMIGCVMDIILMKIHLFVEFAEKKSGSEVKNYEY
jgi:hypothetical protein